jgi:hypothetical protein
MKSSRRDPVRQPATTASCYALQLDRWPVISDNADLGRADEDVPLRMGLLK